MILCSPTPPKALLKKIAELAQGDDRAEWEAFVELYEPPLKRFVHLQSPTMAEADVEDVVQDVFVRLVAVLRDGKIDRTKAKFRAYLASMTRRILIDRYRAAQVRPQLASGGVFVGAGTSSVDGRAVAPRPPLMDAARAGREPYRSGVSATLDPGTMVDVLWRMAAHDSAKDHVFTRTAISSQSKRIYALLERGLSPREVASQLGVSYDSVKQVKSRIDRAIAAVERRIEVS